MATKVREKLPAEIYDEKFVPALFKQWGPIVSNMAGIKSGQSVLDVACGTGALTLAAARAVGPQGHVTGLDANPEMLAVARRKSAEIEWQEGIAESLPFDDESFEAVVSQFGFMFFENQVKALKEMMRVLKPGGRLAVAVCGAVERSPGYGAFAQLLDQLFGAEVGNAFRAPFVLGDPEALRRIAADAEITEALIEEQNGTVDFHSITDMVETERACVWTLGGVLNQEQFDLLLQKSKATLEPYANEEGVVRFDMPVLILVAQKKGNNK